MDKPQGFVTEPEDGGNYRRGKNNLWYTYQDLNIANQIYLREKFEFEKIEAFWPKEAPSKKKKTATKSPASEDTPPEPKAPSRQSSRPRVAPDTLYSAALVEAKEKGIKVKASASSRRRSWDDLYEALKSFQEKHNTCNVPADYKEDWGLIKWVIGQRKLNTISELPTNRKEKLDKLGFDWRTRAEKVEQRWMEQYESLKAYHSAYGHFRVPKTSKLGIWLMTQHRDFRTNKLDPKREALFGAINCSLESRMADQMEKKTTGGFYNPIVIDEESSNARTTIGNNTDGKMKSKKKFKTNVTSVAHGAVAKHRLVPIDVPAKSFERLRPLIADLRSLVEDSHLIDCGYFLDQLIYREKKKSKRATSTASSTGPDAHGRLLCLAMELGTILDESRKSQNTLELCESYLKHLIQKARDETTLEQLALRHLKRRKLMK